MLFLFLSLRKNYVQIGEKAVSPSKICFFWMVLNDAEKTLRTDSSNHNSLFFSSKSLLPKSAALTAKNCTPVAGTKPVSCKDR